LSLALIVIIFLSSPSRTLTPNSEGGSDHGWSGNSFMIGGSINGGTILGEYLDDLTSRNPLNIGKFLLFKCENSEFVFIKKTLH
jgi:uncharacterized protein (DUF1501 family)